MKPTGTFKPPEHHTEVVKCDECCGATFGTIDGLCFHCHREIRKAERIEEVKREWRAAERIIAISAAVGVAALAAGFAIGYIILWS